MELNVLKGILKQHDLRITDCRLDVLDFFIQSEHAISTRALETQFGQYDRVTLYRTINSFTDSGIIHSIPDDSGFARYGLCHETCNPKDHTHDHVHFKCIRCGQIECLPDHHVPTVSIPGYTIRNTELIINGICKSCNS
ncbi:Fur family transcriptional regulator [Marinoscillum sp. MHG1-6]|uniref:Fur family transcriptional regulator n=1 Tax=Marinoscillum sp. MHG1-6 TaxID=2959627 RepID=UPI0035BE6F23